MATDAEIIRTYFAKLGLGREIADMYLALHAHGPQSISELSRNAKVERTRIYRLLETLQSSSLVEVETHYKRNIIKAAPIGNLHILISKKEQELKSLQDELDLVAKVFEHDSLSSPSSRVQFYQGDEGLKQMIWNQTKSKTEIVSTLRQNIQSKTLETFFVRWAETCNERDLSLRSVVSDTFIASQKKWYAKHANLRLAHWQGRHIASNVFAISHNTIIYDDVVGFYNWHAGEVFGIEIYNQEIADEHRQLFEMLWDKAKPLDADI